MRRIFRQGGFLLIVGAILIVIGALLATVVTFLFVARSESGIEHLGGAQALFLAESGREQALRGLVSENTYCSSVSYPNVSFGAGNFSASAALNISARVALGSAVAATDSVIPASSTAGFAAHGRIRIEDEEINYAALSTSCAPFADPACFTGAWRGVAGTAAAAHAANTSVSQEQCLISSVGSVPDIGSQRTIETARRFLPAMMVYTKSTNAPVNDNVPYYRLWEGTAWGPERTALAVVAGANIRFLRLVHARTRNEAILGTQDSGGNISFQVWNGTSWVEQLNPGTSSNTTVRAFDIAYETASDRAVVAYGYGTANSIRSRIWDGSQWAVSTNSFTAATIGQPRWIRMAANPLTTSNEIVLIANGLNGGQNRVYGQRWTGSAWSDMSVAGNWATNGSVTTREGVGVAYEQSSGEALFVWGQAVNNTIAYRTWDGATLGGVSTTTVNLGTTVPNWISMAPDPRSNAILVGVQSVSPQLGTRSWDGSAWYGDSVNHDGGTEAAADRNFDVVFETHPDNPSRAWILWGNGGPVRSKCGTIGGTGISWGGGVCAEASVPSSDDTAYVRLFAHPRTGTVFAALYEDIASVATDDLVASHLMLGGSTWSDVRSHTIWTGPTSDNSTYQRVDISAGRFLPRVDWPEIFR